MPRNAADCTGPETLAFDENTDAAVSVTRYVCGATLDGHSACSCPKEVLNHGKALAGTRKRSKQGAFMLEAQHAIIATAGLPLYRGRRFLPCR